MNVEIVSLVRNADQAQGVVVIIDVLRACTTISALFENGAKEIIPVQTEQEVRQYPRDQFILIGECKDGKTDRLYHYNNSPSEVKRIDFSGKSIVLRTNNATETILNAKQASGIILASFANLTAVARFLQAQNVGLVTLVPLGRLGEKGLEDELCAESLCALLRGESFDFDQVSEKIRECDCARLVIEVLGKPEDVELALDLDSSSIIPRVHIEYGKKLIRGDVL